MKNIFNPAELDFKIPPRSFPYEDKKRFRRAIDFMGQIKGPVLDCGPENFFGEWLADFYQIEKYNTEGDLDVSWTVPGLDEPIKTVFIFDLIEHLKNPDYFLRILTNYLSKDTRIFVIHPYRYLHCFWSYNHYHEIDKPRFKKLVVEAGYDIVRHKDTLFFDKWTFYISGFRPILRLLFGRCHYYYWELRIK